MEPIDAINYCKEHDLLIVTVQPIYWSTLAPLETPFTILVHNGEGCEVPVIVGRNALECVEKLLDKPVKVC